MSRFSVGHNYNAPNSVTDGDLRNITIGADNAAGKVLTDQPELHASEVDPKSYSNADYTTFIEGIYNQSKADNTSITDALIMGYLMQYHPFGGSSSLDTSNLPNLIKDADDGRLLGSNTLAINCDNDVYSAENDYTESNNIFDYAFTNYSRLAYCTSAAVNDNSVSKPNNFSSFYTSRTSGLGIMGPIWLQDSTPIMITKGDSALLGGGYVSESNLTHVGYAEATVEEWGAFATVWRKSLNEEYNNNGVLTPNDIKALKHLQKAVEDFGDIYPAIRVAWQDGTEPFGSKSLEELCTEESSEDVEGMDYLSTIRISPLDMFFTISVVGLDPNSMGANDPWSWFSGTKSSTSVILSEYMKKGISYSASYVPLQTNVYAEDQINLMMESDEDFVKNFHYKIWFPA